MSIVNESKNVEFNRIFVPEDENARTVYEGIEDLAADIKQHGLLQGLVVTNGGATDKPYRLVAGFRRAAALKLLKWGEKTVPVTIVPAQGRAIKNLVENIHRNELRTADLAQRLHDLEKGDYACEKGEEARKYTKEELATELGLSISHITNLIRAHSNLAPALRKEWQKHDLPQNLVFKASVLVTKVEEEVEVKDPKTGKKVKDEEGNVVTKTVKHTVPDEEKQERLLAKWKAAEVAAALAAKGEKKAARQAAMNEGGEGDEGPARKTKPTASVMSDFVKKAKENLKAMSAEKLDDTVEFYRLKGKLEGVQWALGERDGLAARG